MECSALDMGLRDNVELETSSLGPCVDALSRSAQLWSSYSGYLRELPMLCVAFRRLHDIDVAREIYRNATLEKLDFLRYLQSHRSREEKRELRWSLYQENANEIGNDIRAAVLDLQSVFQTQVSDSMVASITKIREECTTSVRSLVSELKIAHTELLQEGGISLEKTVAHHTSELSGVLQTIHTVIDRQTRLLASRLEAHEGQFNVLSSRALTLFSELDTAMQKTVHASAFLGLELSNMLEGASKITRNFEEIETSQQVLSHVSKDLSFSIHALTGHVQSELESINSTLSEIKNWSFGQRILSVWTRQLSLFETPIPWLAIAAFTGYNCKIVAWIVSFLVKTVIIFPVAAILRCLWEGLGPGGPCGQLCHASWMRHKKASLPADNSSDFEDAPEARRSLPTIAPGTARLVRLCSMQYKIKKFSRVPGRLLSQ